MEKEKKPVYKRTWFVLLIVTIIILVIPDIFMNIIRSDDCTGMCALGLASLWGFSKLGSVIVVVLMWIIFAIYSASRPPIPANKKQRTNKQTVVSQKTAPKSVKNSAKKMTFDKFSVIFSIIVNVTSALLVIFFLLGSLVMKIEQVGVMSDGGLIASVSMIFYSITMPVRIVSIILSMISISNNKNKFKSINKMPKETRKLVSMNKKSMIILIILTIVPFLFILLLMTSIRLKFVGV
ncbi:hypothetical protein IJI94_02550 [Candidatus Saccharibacteria bacterium]|nr:hypothetical protein [Candidatus Saccharibacteria bacterium]